MKRLLVFAMVLMVLGIVGPGVSAQDASPGAGTPPTTTLLDGLEYPTLSIGYDGTNLTLPESLQAGRYRVDFSNTSGADPQVLTFLGATADHSLDDILSALQSADLSQGPPPIYYQVKTVGLGTTGGASVVTLTPGDWALIAIGDNGPAIATTTVTGDLPTYDAISDAVVVDLHEMVIDMPDTISAGDHIWQIENTGSFPHMLEIVQAPGPVTDDQVMNALALETGEGPATPVESGSAGDPQSFATVFSGDSFTNGLTQLTELDLQPGTYVAFCFVEGPGDVGLHAMAGMYKIFTVS